MPLTADLLGLPASKLLPHPLPLTHLTVAKWFADIVGNARLRPRPCKVFGDSRLYLFYGGLSYRLGNDGTRDETELPVAFVFDPTRLTEISYYYPFDTGGLHAGRFGEWKESFQPVMDYGLEGQSSVDAPCKLVSAFFGNNERYLRGESLPTDADSPNSISEIRRFLSTDLSAHGADHRQTSIECHVYSEMALCPGLIWIGLPYRCTELFAKLLEKMFPIVPESYRYDYIAARRPHDYCVELEGKAKEVIARYASPPIRRGDE
jgi:hypothetical protein